MARLALGRPSAPRRLPTPPRIGVCVAAFLPRLAPPFSGRLGAPRPPVVHGTAPGPLSLPPPSPAPSGTRPPVQTRNWRARSERRWRRRASDSRLCCRGPSGWAWSAPHGSGGRKVRALERSGDGALPGKRAPGEATSEEALKELGGRGSRREGAGLGLRALGAAEGVRAGAPGSARRGGPRFLPGWPGRGFGAEAGRTVQQVRGRAGLSCGRTEPG